MIKRLLAVVALVWFLQKAHGQINMDLLGGPMCGMVDPQSKLEVAVSPVFTRVNVVVTDAIAQATVKQTFVNPFNGPSEVIYIFPLPDQGSVHGMQYRRKDSLYVAEIMEKSKAIAKYDSIKQNGGQAALLLQDKPNIFQQRIAALGPGETAHVEIRLSMALKYADGALELAFPTLIGPRFGSGQPAQPGSWNPPENREGPAFQFNVVVQSGLELSGISSPSHPIEVSDIASARKLLLERGVLEADDNLAAGYSRAVLLKEQNAYPNRDYVLRLQRASGGQDFAVASHRDSKGQGWFTLSLYPDPAVFQGKRPDLDLVLLVDVSGSQGGWPLEREKEIAQNILARLTAKDDLTVLSFSDNVAYAFGGETPVPATPDNVSKAGAFVRGLTVQGGTQLLHAVQQCLAVPRKEDKQRIYIFLTDGFITNETAILDAIKTHPSRPTVFTFGAGNNLNRFFLEECAKVGNGFATPLMQGDAVVPAVELAWGRIESPQLEDIAISFGGLEAGEVIRPVSTRLYRGLPYTVVGRYGAGGTQSVVLTAKKEGQTFTLTRPVSFATGENLSWSVSKLWAREKIGRLMLEQGTTETNKAAVIAVSLEHQVLSTYTAFLAAKPQSTVPIGMPVDVYRRMDDRPPASRSSLLSVEMKAGLLVLDWKGADPVLMVRVFDMHGRLLFTYRPGSRPLVRWVWDGRNASGGLLGRGRYLVAVQSAQGAHTRLLDWDPGR